jgi:hypothetical protein
VDTATTAATMKAATTAAVRAATTAAVLGKHRLRRTNQGERSKSCEKNFQQGGFPHFSSLHAKAVGCPGGHTASTE